MNSTYEKAVTKHETEKEFNNLVNVFQKLLEEGTSGQDLYDALALARIKQERKKEEKVKV